MDILAPLSGVVVPLEAVPDPVFARKMMGEGVAIDPTSTEVLAPVAGEVTQLHRAHHAIAIRSDDGVEVLVHVGLDTVALDGRGFTPLVWPGARVERGEPVLRFDADAVAASARSLLTAVIVTGRARVDALVAGGAVEAGKTAVLRAARVDAPVEPGSPANEAVVSAELRIPNAAGLHARPAAVLADEAKRFSATVRLVRGAEEADAKSVVALLGLSTRAGDAVRVKAAGADAAEAVARLSRLVAEGCGETASGGPAGAVVLPLQPALDGRRAEPGELVGAPASPGLALGRVVQHRRAVIDVPERAGPAADERARLRGATREAARQIHALAQHASDPSRAQILGVHVALLDDPGLLGLAERLVEEGKSAAFAWREAFTRHAAALEALDNPLMRQRADDLRDVGRRVLAHLAGVAPAQLDVPEGSILVAEDLSPSEVAAFDPTRVAGFCTTAGGSTSHVAILARSMGIPAVCGIDEAALALPDGLQVVVDGGQGVLRTTLDEGYASRVRERIARLTAARAASASAAFELGRTRCGHRVEVVANIRNADDARDALAAGAEGVGLLRSEFLFDRRETPPGEEEQYAAYGAVAQLVGKERPFVVRTLDVGGDKPFPYLPLAKEQNPFLGLRGIRVSLAYPELFRAQLRAILRAAPASNTHVMFPMVATLEELRAAKAILAEEQRGIAHAVKVGVMIEVPSAAIMADVLAREIDFFSIGTNDLTQYTLAMDRNHPRLGREADALHPAVLRMIALTVEGAHERGKWVGVCGGIASDALAVPVLVGLGVDELSVDVPAIAPVKATLSRWTFDECAELATEALKQRTAADVRALLEDRTVPAEEPRPERVMP